MCPDKMGGGKNSFRPQSSTVAPGSSTTQNTSTHENEHTQKIVELTDRNMLLVQEVQKLKLYNANLVKTVVELKRKNVEALSEANRFKESFRRIRQGMERFVPFMVSGSEFLDCVMKETDRNVLAQAEASTAPGSNNDDSFEEVNGLSPTPPSPLRTGIARPIIQGHTIISKPSIALQRVVPGETATAYIPMPVSALNLSGLVRGDDQNGTISEESEEDSGGNQSNGNENADQSEDAEEPDSAAEHQDSAEAGESSSAEDTMSPTPRLSVIPEQSPPPSPAPEERASSSGAASSPQTAKKSRTEESPSNQSAKKSRSEEGSSSHSAKKSRSGGASTSQIAKKRRTGGAEEDEPLETSDDEAVELSLIESRCKLMNSDRRKELKEGTSKDYDARGNFSPHSRRKRKRKKDKEEAPTTEEDETSAIRKSMGGLLNSLKKTRVSRSRVSETADSPVSAKVNGVPEDFSNPRVSLVRLHSWRNSTPALPEEEEAVVPSPMPMVSKRKRGSYVTTRNKRSRRLPVEDAVDVAPHVQEEPARRSSKRMSWTELIRKRSRSREEEENVEMEGEEDLPDSSPSSPPVPDLSGRTVDELTVILSRCSDSFIARNMSQRSNLNESLNSSDLPLAPQAQPANSDGASTANSPNLEHLPKRARAKARSKPKRLAKAPKTNGKLSEDTKAKVDRSSKRSANSVADGEVSQNSLNPSLLNSSAASSVTDSSVVSPSGNSTTGRPRRARAPVNLKEKSLNVKLRRN